MTQIRSSQCKQCGKPKERWSDQGAAGEDYYCCAACADGNACVCTENEYEAASGNAGAVTFKPSATPPKGT